MTTASRILASFCSIMLLGAALTSVGCDDDNSVSAVNVTLREFSVTPDSVRNRSIGKPA